MENRKKQQGFEFIIKESDVLERENFGSFEIVITKTGAIFKNYTGYKVFTAPYAVGLDGVAHETSLYNWLKYMVDFKKSIVGKENDPFANTDTTNQDMLDGMKIVTEANLIKPQVIFTDFDAASREAMRYMEWFDDKAKSLNEAMNTTPPEEDLRANAEFEHNAIMTDIAKEVLDGSVKATEGQV